MKILITTSLFLITTIAALAQTDGISYQAVILDPNPKEIPGVDLEGNILPNATITVRFTILDQNNEEEYQEIQTTETDAYGMINVIIGQGEPTGVGLGEFTLIDWDGTPRSLQVEIDFEGAGSNYVDLNRQELTFVPYALHRNITAEGDMTVDGTTDLNGVLTVQGPTDLNNSLDVTNGNPTVLSGSLRVDSAAQLNSQLTVEGMTNLNDSVNVNNQRPTYFTGDITVDGLSVFNGDTEFNAPAEFVEIAVNGPSNLNGQVTVRANIDTGDQMKYEEYPLLVEGSKQGIAIKVSDNRDVSNNYISFWDNEQMWGRIEGQTETNLKNDEQYKREDAIRVADLVVNSTEAFIATLEWAQGGIDLSAALSSSTVCGGLGACVTAPIPSFITSKTVNVILRVGNIAVYAANIVLAEEELRAFRDFTIGNIGVSYQSGAGDYAEWLPKQNPSDVFTPGEVIGVNNGFVTKNTWSAEKIMVVSTRPIVLGNMPQPNDEYDYVKIAFMGQVPVKVIGDVSPGDYLLPSEFSGGFAKAVHPTEMKIRDYKKIAGVVWSITGKLSENIQIVNAAVGINTNDLYEVVHQQDEEIKTLRSKYEHLEHKLDRTNHILAQLLPEFAEASGYVDDSDKPTEDHHHIIDEDPVNDLPGNMTYSSEDDIVYFEISEKQVEDAIEIAREYYSDMVNGSKTTNSLLSFDNDTKVDVENLALMPLSEHPFWQKIDNDPAYKDEIVKYIQSALEKAMHTHKKHSHKFTNLKMHN